MLRRRIIQAALPAIIFAHSPGLVMADQGLLLRVIRDPGCNCCAGWAKHMALAGFEVRMEERPRADPLRRTSGAPPGLMGCHVGLHDRFAFEGHVPAAAVRRFLADPGPWRGLAVPGMPVGSPGMEVEGMAPQTYDIVRFDQKGRLEVFARARGADLL